MGCSSCSTNNGLPGGCKNNGACGTYGCNKLEVFDWLAGMQLPEGQKPFDVAEVRFKNSRKAFYRIPSGVEVFAGDVVAVEATPGHDIGVVSLTGELVRVQMKRKDIRDNYELKKIYRKARQEDIEKWQEARKLEKETMMRSREIARELNLQMKISDVEYQGDKTKATFFYTAEDRVDFRELIKRYAEAFKVRVDMRQIGLRQEAGRLGGIGSCGRELCCSSWLTDFRAVSTSAARYQQLSLNPTKLAGQCGKLKCCLNYELDQYVEALKDFPSTNAKLRLQKGVAVHFKTDIFKRTLYYIFEDQPGEAPVALHVDAVKQILEMNRKGVMVEDIADFAQEEEVAEETDFAQVVGQDSLTRFDKRRGGNNNKRRGGKGGRDRNQRDQAQNRGQQPQRAPQDKQQRPQGEGNAPEQRNEQRPPREQRPSNDRPRQDRPPREPRTDNDRPRQERPPREPRPNNDRPRPERPPREGGEQQQGGEGQRPPRNDRGRNRGRGRGPRREGGGEQSNQTPPAPQP